MSLTGYRLDLGAADTFRPDDPRLAPLQACANQHRLTLVVGAPVPSPQGLHIGAIILGPHQAPKTHFKVHLHPGEEGTFTPGLPKPPLRLGPETVGLAICADITHPEHVRSAAAQRATIYAAGCFLTPKGYLPDTTLLRGYAAAYGLAVLMANFGAPSSGWASAGRSAIWQPRGELVVEGPPAGAAILLARRHRSGWQGRVLRHPVAILHAV